MLKVYAAIKHNPPEAYGDCFRACLSSLLETEAPHVLHDGCDANEQRQRLDDWLRPRGLAFMEWPIQHHNVLIALKIGRHYTRFSEINYMLSGVTVRGSGHYVVCRGEAIVHNPSPGWDIVEPFDDGVFWFGLIAERT